MVLGMVPDCVNVQEDRRYICRYTLNPCVGRTFDAKYDVDVKRCPLYLIRPFLEGDNKLIKRLRKKRELPSDIERVINEIINTPN